MKRNGLTSFICSSLLYIFLITFFISFLVFGLYIEDNYFSKCVVGATFLIINIIISSSLLIFNIVYFIKINYIDIFNDDENTLHIKLLVIYLILLYLIGALIAIIY